MRRHARGLTAGALLALAIGFLAASSSQCADDEDEKEIKAAQDAVVKLSGMKHDEAQKAAEAMAKKHDLGHVMYIFKPRDKKGIGVGPKGKGDGIELKLNSLSKRALAKMELAKQSNDLVRMTEITRAVSELVPHYAPKEKKAGKDPANWKKYADEMREGSLDLAKAVKGGDPKVVHKAAARLNDSCTNCHSEFRDSN
jgi:cytochrome c556